MAKLVEDRIEEMVVSALKIALGKERTELIDGIYCVLADEYSCETNAQCEDLESEVERGINKMVDKLLKTLE